jgi:LPXTG-motif cell wall-anchored protein
VRVKSQVLRRLSGYAAATVAATAGLVAFTASPASAHDIEITPATVCDPSTGHWVITWGIDTSRAPVPGVVQEPLISTPEPGLSGFTVGMTVEPNGSLIGIQSVPASTPSAFLSVTIFWDHPGTEDDVTRTAAKTVTLTGTCEQGPPDPEVAFADECDGSVVVTLSNGPNAVSDAHFTVTGPGGFSETHTVTPDGATTVTVPASAAGGIVVSEDGKVLAEHSWQDPGECPTTAPPTTAPPTTGPPDLPDTGTSLSTLIVVAVALIAVGAGLLLVLRRRRAGVAG